MYFVGQNKEVEMNKPQKTLISDNVGFLHAAIDSDGMIKDQKLNKSHTIMSNIK